MLLLLLSTLSSMLRPMLPLLCDHSYYITYNDIGQSNTVDISLELAPHPPSFLLHSHHQHHASYCQPRRPHDYLTATISRSVTSLRSLLARRVSCARLVISQALAAHHCVMVLSSRFSTSPSFSRSLLSHRIQHCIPTYCQHV